MRGAAGATAATATAAAATAAAGAAGAAGAMQSAGCGLPLWLLMGATYLMYTGANTADVLSSSRRPPPDGCGLPRWESQWSMAGSLYAYCIGQCAINWLANHTEHGRFAGVVGFDHYWTHQGMPCLSLIHI